MQGLGFTPGASNVQDIRRSRNITVTVALRVHIATVLRIEDASQKFSSNEQLCRNFTFTELIAN